ncbi:prepilin peptidase [Methylorubrum sp. POS3]|uniref:prepilin peptidase n=1 Tax=Methylorubrum sp. POS3 TaxID=2998492 RepID=UPI00372D14C3
MIGSRIPNWIPCSMIGGYALAAVAVKMPDSVLAHVTLSVFVFIIGLYLFSQGAVGGGAMKLMTAASLWIGPNGIFIEFAATIGAFVVLKMAICSIIYRKIDNSPIPLGILTIAALVIHLPRAPTWLAVIERLSIMT